MSDRETTSSSFLSVLSEMDCCLQRICRIYEEEILSSRLSWTGKSVSLESRLSLVQNVVSSGTLAIFIELWRQFSEQRALSRKYSNSLSAHTVVRYVHDVDDISASIEHEANSVLSLCSHSVDNRWSMEDIAVLCRKASDRDAKRSDVLTSLQAAIKNLARVSNLHRQRLKEMETFFSYENIMSKSKDLYDGLKSLDILERSNNRGNNPNEISDLSAGLLSSMDSTFHSSSDSNHSKASQLFPGTQSSTSLFAEFLENCNACLNRDISSLENLLDRFRKIDEESVLVSDWFSELLNTGHSMLLRLLPPEILPLLESWFHLYETRPEMLSDMGGLVNRTDSLVADFRGMYSEMEHFRDDVVFASHLRENLSALESKMFLLEDDLLEARYQYRKSRLRGESETLVAAAKQNYERARAARDSENFSFEDGLQWLSSVSRRQDFPEIVVLIQVIRNMKPSWIEFVAETPSLPGCEDILSATENPFLNAPAGDDMHTSTLPRFSVPLCISDHSLPFGLLSSKFYSAGTRFSDFSVLQRLSEHVFVARRDGRTFVVKKYLLDMHTELFVNEICVMQRLQHRTIIPMETFFVEDRIGYIVFQYVASEPLSRWMSRSHAPDELRNVLREVLESIFHMHTRDVVYANLSADVVSVDALGRVLISSFEHARLLRSPLSKPLFPYHMADAVHVAPELRREILQSVSLLEKDFTRTNNQKIETIEVMPKDQMDAKEDASSLNSMSTSELLSSTSSSNSPSSAKTLSVSTLCDMWSFGVLCIQIFHGDVHAVQFSLVRNKAWFEKKGLPLRVIDVASKLLQEDPNRRLGCIEAMSDPFFLTSAVRELEDNGYVVSTQAKLRTIEKTFDTFFASNQSRYHWGDELDFHLHRETIVQDFIEQCWYTPEILSTRTFNIYFSGEIGVDAGGLFTDAVHRFFGSLRSSPLFDHEMEGVGSLPHVDCMEKPSSLSYIELSDVYRRTGYILAVAFIHRRLIPIDSFPSSLWKCMLDMQDHLDMRDLEMYDPSMYRGLKALLLETNVDDLCMDFSMAGGSEEEPVTNENKLMYVRTKVMHHLYSSRKKHISDMKNGFWEVCAQLNADVCLRLLNHSELVGVLAGSQMVTCETLWSRITWRGGSEQLRGMFFQVLVDWEKEDPQLLTRFVQFVTGLPGVPSSWSLGSVKSEEIRISVFDFGFDRFIPRAHLCFWSLDLFAYTELKELRNDLDRALENIDAGFFIS